MRCGGKRMWWVVGAKVLGLRSHVSQGAMQALDGVVCWWQQRKRERWRWRQRQWEGVSVRARVKVRQCRSDGCAFGRCASTPATAPNKRSQVPGRRLADTTSDERALPEARVSLALTLPALTSATRLPVRCPLSACPNVPDRLHRAPGASGARGRGSAATYQTQSSLFSAATTKDKGGSFKLGAWSCEGVGNG